MLDGMYYSWRGKLEAYFFPFCISASLQPIGLDLF